jgi:hypothetical protein
MLISKKIRYNKKILSNKKQIAGRPQKDNEFNIEINYNGPLITKDLWRQFSNELRMGTGYNLTKSISEILNDPFLSVCRSTAIIRNVINPDLDLVPLDNSIMISCDKTIPHYYIYKPHVINLMKKLILRGNFDDTQGAFIPLKVGINLYIKNGDVLEHDIISNDP